MSRRLTRWILAAILVVALVASAGCALIPGSDRTHVTVELARAVGLSVGDDARVLGVPVGEVVSIEPTPEVVRVGVELDEGVQVPADAKAVVLSPSLVSIRFVQFTPVYRGGPALTDGATVPMSHTAVPAEFDDLKQEANQLMTALGPRGANKNGALGRALDTAADNVRGQGAAINNSIEQMARAASTLSRGEADLFTTVRNLNGFVSALIQNDREVRGFINQLATFSGVLADNKAQLATALNSINEALGKTEAFVREHRGDITKTTGELKNTMATFSDLRQTVADILQFGPVGVQNLYNSYDATNGSISAQLANQGIDAPAQLVCSALFSLGGTPSQCHATLAPLLNMIAIDQLPVGTNPVKRSGSTNQASQGNADEKNRRDGESSSQQGSRLPGLGELLLPGGGR